jgi:hypothetical protein
MKTTQIAVPTLLAVLLLPLPSLHAQTLERVPVLLDTDIGSGIDDAFALALILASPELELRGVSAVGKDAQMRALFLCRFLTKTGRRHVAVAAGDGDQPIREMGSVPTLPPRRALRPHDQAGEGACRRVPLRPH